jgi:hypothetical protein
VPDGFNISASIDPLDFTIIRSTTGKVRRTCRASPATSDLTHVRDIQARGPVHKSAYVSTASVDAS